MYFSDLTPCTYATFEGGKLFKAIGWLDNQHEFPRGTVSELFMARLWEFCQNPIICFYGFHDCDFCGAEKMGHGILAERDAQRLRLGATIMGVLDKFDPQIAYASPDMIYHYITEHQYLPPQPFIDAILNSPPPNSLEYEDLFKEFFTKS